MVRSEGCEKSGGNGASVGEIKQVVRRPQTMANTLLKCSSVVDGLPGQAQNQSSIAEGGTHR